MQKSIEQLKRLGNKVNCGGWSWNVFQDERGTVLSDGQVSCWGPDDEIAAVLAELPAEATFEETWDALSVFPSDA